MNNIWLLLLLQFVLIGLNAIFACAEIAVISTNEQKLEMLSEKGDKRAKRLLTLTRQPAKFLATIQVAITLSGFLGSAFAADHFSDMLVTWLLGLGAPISRATLDTLAVILITLILSFFTLVLGELVPKRVAMRKAESLALGISGLVYGISKIFAPLVWLLTASTNGLLRLFRIDPNADENDVSEEDIRLMVDAGNKKGSIDNEEKEFIQNIFEFDDLTAGEIATHRTDVAFLWIEESDEEWDRVIKEARHTYFPICEESVDNVVGILNAKEYFRLDNFSRENVMQCAVKPAYFVPDGVKADVLFRNMKKERVTIAVVMDEHGGMAGIVTVNDLIECLVGDLADDEAPLVEEKEIEKIDDKTFRVKGDTLLDDLEEAIGVAVPREECETVSGLALATYGAIPAEGSSFEVEIGLLSITAEQVLEHQVEVAIVRLLNPVEDAEEEQND